MQAPKTFRPYQTEAIKAILSQWQQSRTCLAVMPTGAGKTIVAAGTTKAIIERPNPGRVLFLANRNELCTQPFEAFTEQLGFVPELEKAESRASHNAPVVIGSVQTLSLTKRLEQFRPDHFSHIFADEAHMSMAKSWQRIFQYFENAKICGITATPFRSDAKILRDVYEAEAYRKNLFELVDEGWLVNPDHVFKLQSAISLAQVRIKQSVEGKDYDLQDAADAILPYFKEIAEELVREHSKRHILAFLPLVASSQKFVAACVEAGINAVHVDGEDPQRAQKLQAFKDGRIQLLSNSNLLHTGVDFPVCDATLCLRPTRSKVLYQQVVGRSTRPLAGLVDAQESVEGRLEAIRKSAKPDALIIDPLWLSTDHDLVTPSFLIADNQEEAEEIERRAKKNKDYSLAAIKAAIQREREEAIARRLANAARFREGRLDYQCLAASPGEHRLLTYEPVFKKECRPPSAFTLSVLHRMGIDTENVTSQGLAEEIKRAIGRRRYQGRAEIRDLAPVAETIGVNPEIWKIKKTDTRIQA
jgi:superfamily II DNA or RNA helicase